MRLKIDGNMCYIKGSACMLHDGFVHMMCQSQGELHARRAIKHLHDCLEHLKETWLEVEWYWTNRGLSGSWLDGFALPRLVAVIDFLEDVSWW